MGLFKKKTSPIAAEKKDEVYHQWATEKDYELKDSFWDDDERNRKISESDREAKVRKSPEAIVYDVIEENLSEYYYCIPHVALREIFRPKDELGEDKYYLRHLSSFHVDFLLLDKGAGLPIELDGKSHETGTFDKSRGFKEKIFKRTAIPVIYIRLSELDLQTMIFQDAVKEKLYSELEIEKLYDEPEPEDWDHPIAPVYCSDCAKRMRSRERADGTGRFFYCANCQQSSGKNKTINSGKIAPILKLYSPCTKEDPVL